MLSAILDHYLQGVSEREFDSPLMALLLSKDFHDIHKIHGTFEFGKDFIAKRRDAGVDYQYALQSKAGDINLKAWREVRTQLDDARYNGIAHPSYDRSLPKKVILVTTGRLVGGAAADAQEYKHFLRRRDHIRFNVWDRDKLRHWLTRDPACGLADGLLPETLALVAMAEQRSINHQQLERYMRKWVVLPLHRVAIESAVVASVLRSSRRADLAAVVALGMLRASHAQGDSPHARLFQASARQLYTTYAVGLLRKYENLVKEPKLLIGNIDSTQPFFSYSVVCHRLAEVFGLLAMAPHVPPSLSIDANTALQEIVSNQPGISRPLSDRWALSLICAATALFEDCPGQVQELLKAVVIWISDSYENGPGLAPVDCSELTEIEYVLGWPFAHVDIRKRQASYLSTVVLDLCALFNYPDLYRTALNDFRAVRAVPMLTLADERLAKWGAGEFGTQLIPQVRYEDPERAVGNLAAHHSREAIGNISAWDALALACLPRNRHPFWAICELLH